MKKVTVILSVCFLCAFSACYAQEFDVLTENPDRPGGSGGGIYYYTFSGDSSSKTY